MANEIEIAIQKRVDAEVGKKLVSVLKRVRVLQMGVDKLHDDLTALTDDPQKPIANGAAPKEKKSRAAISVTDLQLEQVRSYLHAESAHYPKDAFTPGDIAKGCEGLSAKLVGAAIRSLVKRDEAFETPGGKFRARIQEEATTNG